MCNLNFPHFLTCCLLHFLTAKQKKRREIQIIQIFSSNNRHFLIFLYFRDFNICATISWEVFINQRNHFLSCSPDYKTATFQPIINCTVSLNRLWLGKNNSFENQSIICKVHDLDAHYSISCCLLSNPTSRSCFLRKLSDFSFWTQNWEKFRRLLLGCS